MLVADVSVSREVERAITSLLDAFGALDLIAHAAGIAMPEGEVVDMTEQDWDTLMNTNAKSCFLLAKYGIPAMRAQGGGSVVNVSSVCATAAAAGGSLYAASKGALNAFTRIVALETQKDAIRFNTVAPGLVLTPMLETSLNQEGPGYRERAERFTPLGRFIEPEEVASMILYLLSDEASAISGEIHHVDGAWLGQINLAEISPTPTSQRSKGTLTNITKAK